ncbi:Pyruvate dehydrogenase (acetyl-transferring) [Acidothermus cellulolyticus 11B]|uniref:Pyruvate dehydrogenase (Acetyl-transferring) n=1 Tax=Acidothermus cellulolyticus (strain ATCC 43068 / DSM 8971 / 11B) TaxID=351607 RepID=A0LQU9_ACIC1|nr:pyruvate dehydrogenase (acetyl-transferring) E1 component subunit alpha [Acidothermus cellulolyticus]ABK51809.1 Pyruvate dehydrogenase (acetyl-transferring) [Acidothermus cellulolyticus 11B]
MTVDSLHHTVAPAEAGPADPTLVQLLTPEGQRRGHPDFPLEIADDDVRALYRDMVALRRFDVEATTLQRQGELGIWAQVLGQEAAQIGSARALRPTDMVFPTYREHGVAWCRGIPPEDILQLFRGINFGGWDPAAYHVAPYTIVIGAHALHAVGYAMALQREPGNDSIAIAYFGDGATSEGDVNEAFVFAASYRAPVIFFVQNNQWAISVPEIRQSPIPLYQRAAGFGFPGVRVDGNDVLACLAVTRAAAAHVRAGNGPYLIEAFTYRMGAHTTSDDPTRYRLAAEVEAWKLRDPIERVKAYLSRSGAADADFFTDVDTEAERLAERVRAACVTMPDPGPLTMFDHVYAAGSAMLDAEKAAYAEYLASFEEA